MSKITTNDNGITCRTCQSFHEAHRCVCKCWCEATMFYAESDDVVCARYVARAHL